MICGEVRSPAYEAIHTRRIFFVAGQYWLIVDSLRGSVPHKYDLRFHLTAEALNHCTRITGGIRTPDMVLLSAGTNPALSHGWISPRYGIKQRAPVVSFVSTGEANTDFYTLIAPRELSAPLPQFQVLSEGDVRIERVGENFTEVDELTWHSAPAWTGSVPPRGSGWVRSLQASVDVGKSPHGCAATRYREVVLTLSNNDSDLRGRGVWRRTSL
jgi:hypothetical protein